MKYGKGKSDTAEMLVSWFGHTISRTGGSHTVTQKKITAVPHERWWQPVRLGWKEVAPAQYLGG